MNNFLMYIRKMDVFSVPFTPSLNLKTKAKSYSSVIGGMITLIIFTFSLFYGIRLLQQWIQYEMPFKISTQEKQYLEEIFVNYFQQNNYTDKFTINVDWNNYIDDADFFAKESILLIPLLHDVASQETYNLLEYYDNLSQVINLTLSNLNNQDYVFYLVSCLENQQYLSNDQSCASQEKFDYYINLAGLEADLHVQMNKLNLVTNEQEQTNVYTECFIQNNFSTFKVVNIQYSYYEIIGGFFQEHKSQYMLTTDFSVRDQMGTIDYITNYNQYYDPNIQNIRASFYITSRQLINQVIIQYPTIGEVLANIGSITQMMLFIGFLLRYVNTKWMIADFKLEFKKQFFPQLFIITEKKVGRSIQYFLENKQINPKSYKEFQQTIDDKIEEKMNYQNLLYEVSRIQIVLEQITTQYKILQSHLKQFQLDLIYDKNQDNYQIYNYWDQKQVVELQPRNTLAPFALSLSMKRQSEQFCKILSDDRESISPQTEMLFSNRFHDQ